ncbi:MAG TPA: hypothetical protein VFV75_02560 [Candidatus Polarisedimenticolaceae bacterium]|nr:hypothetical protein [Candidatus Polarisedimenticolaceae bacterium]
MRKSVPFVGITFLVLILLLVFVPGRRAPAPQATPSPTQSPAGPAATAPPPGHPSFLHGRVLTKDGATYEGRLRWGASEEAFWGDYFNGVKGENPWVALAPLERLPQESHTFRFLGIEFGRQHRLRDLGRRFMARFGDIARIEGRGAEVRVTLKSGTTFDLRRMDASDFDDGVRVWDARRGVVDLDSLRIDTIEFLSGSQAGPAPDRLHGTVRTRQGAFTGFLQWNRNASLGSDELAGRSAGEKHSLRFDSLRSIARRSPEGALVTLVDGRVLEFGGTGDLGNGNLGVYVDDPRFGRVLVSWDAFERVDFGPPGSGPAYADFPKGLPLTGSVVTIDGRRLAGRLVYDLDESETTETFDAPSEGVDYTIPFGLVASIVLGNDAQPAEVTLHNGERLRLERSGDLGEANAGMLVFGEGAGRPEYVPWSEVQRVDLDRPLAMFPPLTAP